MPAASAAASRAPAGSRSTNGRSPASGRSARKRPCSKRRAGTVSYRFQARDLNLVLAPPASGAPARFTVRLDGQAPGDAHGVDVDESGEGTVSEPRMYQLVRQRGAIAPRMFEITFRDPGVRAYVFTFG